jgi:hypothetical protein
MRKLLLAVVTLLFLLALNALAQDSATTVPEEGTPAPAAQPEPLRPLSGALLQSSGKSGIPSGKLVPSLTFSETTTTLSGTTDYRANIVGDLAYDQLSPRHAFTLRYSGGGLFDVDNSDLNRTFQQLYLSESFTVRRWNFLFGDALAYMPQSPIGGGFGIPGLGQFTSDLSLTNLYPNLVPSQSILTLDTSALNNSTFAQGQYNFTRQTSVTGVASYGLLRYPDESALDGHQMFFSTGLNHSIGRAQVALQGSYSHFSYEATNSGMESEMLQLMYSRPLGHSFSMQIGAGPESVHPLGSTAHNRLTESGLAALSYRRKQDHVTLRYTRGANGGSGLLMGVLADNVQLSAGHQGRFWGISATGGYARSSGIIQSVTTSSNTAGAQVTRTFHRNMKVYFSYTYLTQDAGTLCVAGTCALNTHEHIFGIGFHWNPRGLRVGE